MVLYGGLCRGRKNSKKLVWESGQVLSKKRPRGGVKATYDASKATYDVFILAAKPLFSRGVVIKVLNKKVTTPGFRPGLLFAVKTVIEAKEAFHDRAHQSPA